MNPKKVIKIVLIVVGALLFLAVIAGVLNALVGGGNWYLGWQSYRYDDSGFETGDGTIRADGIRRIYVDWIDGAVEVVVCQDRYLSVTEETGEELTENNRIRWQVSEDGSTLNLRYRKSSWFLGSSGRNQKRLILRIPERLLGEFELLEIKAVSAPVTVTGVRAKQITVTGTSGSVSAQDCVCNVLSVTSVGGDITCSGTVSQSARLETSGGALQMRSTICPTEMNLKSTAGKNVTLTLPMQSGFLLENIAPGISYELPLVRTEDGKYRCGDGSASIRIETSKGNVMLFALEKHMEN